MLEFGGQAFKGFELTILFVLFPLRILNPFGGY